MSTCIDVFDDTSHSSTSLVIIFTGKVVDDKTVKVDNAVSIGTTQCFEYERTWLKGFHDRLKKKVNDRNGESFEVKSINAAISSETLLLRFFFPSSVYRQVNLQDQVKDRMQ